MNHFYKQMILKSNLKILNSHLHRNLILIVGYIICITVIIVIEEIKTDMNLINDRILKQLDRKSNIKDVCALLDLKSSK